MSAAHTAVGGKGRAASTSAGMLEVLLLLAAAGAMAKCFPVLFRNFAMASCWLAPAVVGRALPGTA